MEDQASVENLFKTAFPGVTDKKVMVIHTSIEDTYLSQEIAKFEQRTGFTPTDILVVSNCDHFFIADVAVPYLAIQGVGNVFLNAAPEFITGQGIRLIYIMGGPIRAFLFETNKVVYGSHPCNHRAGVSAFYIDCFSGGSGPLLVEYPIDLPASDLGNRMSLQVAQMTKRAYAGDSDETRSETFRCAPNTPYTPIFEKPDYTKSQVYMMNRINDLEDRMSHLYRVVTELAGKSLDS